MRKLIPAFAVPTLLCAAAALLAQPLPPTPVGGDSAAVAAPAQAALAQTEAVLARIQAAPAPRAAPLGRARAALELAQAAVAEPAANGLPDLPVAPGAPPGTETLGGLPFGPAPGAPLVVLSSPSKPGRLGEINEDLTIMTRILEKAVAQPGAGNDQAMAMGIVLHSLGTHSTPRGLYLEGYGAVFLLEARFPLSAPPKVAEPAAEKPADTTWNRTKAELYGPRERRAGPMMMGWAAGPGFPGAVPYSAERVEQLKRGLLEALPNASHLRDVKPDEAVVVVVRGAEAGSGRQVMMMGNGIAAGAGNWSLGGIGSGNVVLSTPPMTGMMGGGMAMMGGGGGMGGMSAGGGGGVVGDAHGGYGGQGAAQNRIVTHHAGAVLAGGADGGGATLVIKVKKSDAEAFAKGKLTLDEFRKGATVNLY